MTALPAACAALGSALSYAVATVLQHRAAHQAPAGHGMHVGLLAHLATRPLWLAGLTADVAALGLHVFALSKGELALVQPLLVSGLLFALPASVLLEHRHPSLTEWSWAAVLIGALALFLVVGHPSVGHNLTDTDRLAVLTGAGTALTAAVAVTAKQLIPRHQAALLGLAAGIAFGLTAALLKQATTIGTGPHPLQLVKTWPLYVLLAIGGGALVLSQAAYQSGPLAASLPPLTMADPLVAIALGVAVFDEDLTHSVTSISLQVITFAAMTLAAIQLARRSTSSSAVGGRTPQPVETLDLSAQP